MKKKLEAILKALPSIVKDHDRGLTLQDLHEKYKYAIGTLRKYIGLYKKYRGDLASVRYTATRKMLPQSTETETDGINNLQREINRLNARVDMLEGKAYLVDLERRIRRLEDKSKGHQRRFRKRKGK